MENLKDLLAQLSQTEHGFKHIIEAGDNLLKDDQINHFEISKKLISHESYQGRMLATYLLGALSPENQSALKILKDTVAKDENWRVQEMLAKAFDSYANAKGYENVLPEIRDWLQDKNPNVIRAVTEGLRIWTGRPYFKDNPETAISLLSQHKNHESEYVRKSVGNALRDIGRKHPDLIKKEIDSWDLNDKKAAFTKKLVSEK